MATDFDAEIASAQQAVQRLRDRMDTAMDAWIDATAPYVKAYWLSRAKEAVISESEVSEGIGASKVQELRRQVEAMAGTVDVYVRRGLVDETRERWPHLKPQTDALDSYFTTPASSSRFTVENRHQRPAAPSLLARPLGAVLADVLPVLRQFGYEQPAGGGLIHQTGPRESVPADFQPPWTQEMVDAIDDYRSLHDEYISALALIDSLKTEKRQAAAAAAWGD